MVDEPWIFDLLGDITRARQGFLPEAGGVGDQDPRFVEAWEILDKAVALLQAREQRRAAEANEKRLKNLERQIEGRKKKGRRR